MFLQFKISCVCDDGVTVTVTMAIKNGIYLKVEISLSLDCRLIKNDEMRNNFSQSDVVELY